jgi:hypothetical protein
MVVSKPMYQNIKPGKYKACILSLEAYKDVKRLCAVLLSEELANWCHITVADEPEIRARVDNRFLIVYQ